MSIRPENFKKLAAVLPGPVGPVAPGVPVSPVGPVGPVAPVDPVAPVGPVGPVPPVFRPLGWIVVCPMLSHGTLSGFQFQAPPSQKLVGLQGPSERGNGCKS